MGVGRKTTEEGVVLFDLNDPGLLVNFDLFQVKDSNTSSLKSSALIESLNHRYHIKFHKLTLDWNL